MPASTSANTATPAHAAVLTAGFVLALTSLAPACAQTNLREALYGSQFLDQRKPQYPVVGRFVAAQGDTFVLDRSGDVALLKFEDSPEVFALQPMPGPRGDVIWKNDIGQPVLRSTRLGGLILFTSERPTGTPAAFSAPSTDLKPRPMSPGVLLRQLAQASTKASRAARRLLPFEAPEVEAEDAAVYADAAHLVAQGVVTASGTEKGRSLLARIRKVRFTQGPKPSALVKSGTLEVVVAPDQGLAGRPSSRRAELAILRR